MSPVFLTRLVLDFVAVGFFVMAMAYWWLDNRTHELVGTVMFALLFLHNVFNRRWWGRLPKTRRASRPWITVVLNLTLLVSMVALMSTSVLVSQSLFRQVAVGGATAREIHILAAYWSLVVVALHLGLHWSIVMNVARAILGISGKNATRTLALRLASVGITVHGVHSSFELGIWPRLLNLPTMQFWDFNEDTVGFFIHLGSLLGSFIVLGHYTIVAIGLRPRRTEPAMHPN